MKKYISIAVMSISLIGCAAGPSFTPAVVPTPKENMALVYLYREPALMSGAYTTRFEVNGKTLANLINGGYTWVHHPAGEYDLKNFFRQSFLFAPDVRSLSVKWQAGRTYYYRFVSGGGDSNYFGVTFKEVSEAEALPEIQKRSYQPYVEGAAISTGAV